MNTSDAIKFVKELGRIVARDGNHLTPWEIHCTQDYDKMCYGIYFLVEADQAQRLEARRNIENASRE